MKDKELLISAMEVIINSLHNDEAYELWWNFTTGYWIYKKIVFKTPAESAADEDTFKSLTALFPVILTACAENGFEADGKLYPEGRELKESEV